MEQAQLLREIIPNPRARNRECAVLHKRFTGKRDHQNSPLSRAKGSATLGSRHRPTEIRRCKAKLAPPEQKDDYIQCTAGQEANAEHLTYMTRFYKMSLKLHMVECRKMLPKC